MFEPITVLLNGCTVPSSTAHITHSVLMAHDADIQAHHHPKTILVRSVLYTAKLLS